MVNCSAPLISKETTWLSIFLAIASDKNNFTLLLKIMGVQLCMLFVSLTSC